jgi:hypothetical protein
LREASGEAQFPFEVADYENNLKMLRSHLDAATFAARWAEGRVMSLEQAIEFALEQD